jgi:hypothetical protein
MFETNGSGRLDRIEVSLEKLTEKSHLMVDHHEAEFKQRGSETVQTPPASASASINCTRSPTNALPIWWPPLYGSPPVQG